MHYFLCLDLPLVTPYLKGYLMDPSTGIKTRRCPPSSHLLNLKHIFVPKLDRECFMAHEKTSRFINAYHLMLISIFLQVTYLNYLL